METFVNKSHSAAMMKELHKLKTDSNLTDISLVTSDGQTILAHKLVLAAASSYFRQHFISDSITRDVFEIDGVQHNILQDILHYIYTGVACIKKNTLLEVLSATCKLGVESLSELCRAYIDRNGKTMGFTTQELADMRLASASGSVVKTEPNESDNVKKRAKSTRKKNVTNVPKPVIDNKSVANHRGRGRPRSTRTRKNCAKPVSPVEPRYEENDETEEEDMKDVDDDEDYVPNVLTINPAPRKRSVTRGSTTRSRRKSVESNKQKCFEDSKKRYICSVCGEGRNSALRLKQHKFTDHGFGRASSCLGLRLALRYRKRRLCRDKCKKINGGYLCRKCGRMFTSRSGYRGHEIIAHRRQPHQLGEPAPFIQRYACKSCDRPFLHESNFTRHRTLVHGEMMPCRHKLQAAKSVSIVGRLVAKCRLRSRKKSCRNRSKIRSVTLINKHVPLQEVDDQETFCQLCRMMMPSNLVLTEHLHLEHKVFTFALSDSVRKKVRFKCPNCVRLPRQLSFKKLRHHVRSHHNHDIRSQCFYCGRVLNSRTALNHHLMSSHKIHASILRLEPLHKSYISGDLTLSDSKDEPGTIRCHYCRKIVSDDTDLAYHLRTIHYQFATFNKVKSDPGLRSDDLYECARCHLVFRDIDRMQAHFVEEHGPGRRGRNKTESAEEFLGVYRCREENCFHEAREETDLIAHMESDHKETKYDCPHCSYSTTLYYQLVSHVTRHDKGYVCDMCGTVCRKRSQLKVHKWKKHGLEDNTIKMHKCPVEGCRFQSYQKSAIKQHQIKHVKDKPFLCPHCGRSLKTAKSLESHISKVHMNIRPYICEVCGRAFSKKCEIRAHVKIHSQEQLKCEHCKFVTMNKYSMISHLLSKHNIQMREHEKLHFCPMCPYRTMREKHLTNHINSHLNVRDFVCDLCGKSFISASSLKGHHNWVHNEKQHKCEFCQYKGGSLSNLKQHIRIMHTQRGLKPYKCAYCDFRCELSGNCRVHCRSAHKGLEIKWVKVVDFNLEIPGKDMAEEIRSAASERSKQKNTSPCKSQVSSSAAPMDESVQHADVSAEHSDVLRKLLKSVEADMAPAPFANVHQTARTVEFTQQNINMSADQLALSQRGAGVAQTSSAPIRPAPVSVHNAVVQQTLFTTHDHNDPYQLIYMTEALPTNRPYYASPGVYEAAPRTAQSIYLTADVAHAYNTNHAPTNLFNN